MDKHLINALSADPQGTICYRCTSPNNFYDDCGFFYVRWNRNTTTDKIQGEYRAICEKCFNELGLNTYER